MPPLPSRSPAAGEPISLTAHTGEHPAVQNGAPPSMGFCEAPDRLEQFLAALETARDKRVLIVIKGHPDPDSIGSAIAQKRLGGLFGITSTIVYFDEISHPENRALVKALEVQLHQYREDMDLADFDYLSFVDCQSPHLPVTVEDLPPILTFVDHHKTLPGAFEGEPLFTDIREDAGSTCAIYAEYMEHSIHGLRLNKASDSRLATAMMHGIRADSDSFLLAQPIDYRAGAYLRQFLDNDLLRLISKQSISVRTMEIIQRGLNRKVIRDTFLVAGVGFVREEDRDGIAQTADFLLRHEGIETAVVYGIVNGDVVDGSLRTTSPTIDPDAWLKAVFGADSAGRPYGGGRRNKGGFRIPLGLLSRTRDRDTLWSISKKTIDDLVFEKIGVSSATEGATE